MVFVLEKNLKLRHVPVCDVTSLKARDTQTWPPSSRLQVAAVREHLHEIFIIVLRSVWVGRRARSLR